MAQAVILDVRDMEPPQPYEAATKALSGLEQGQYLHMISRRRPRLLYPWLAQHGFTERTRELGEEHFELYIWRADDPDAGTAFDNPGY